MTQYPLHEDYRKLRFSVPLNPVFLPFLQCMTRYSYDRQSIPDGIVLSKRTIGHVPIDIFSPKSLSDTTPCLLFLHGGAFALPASAFHKRLACQYALRCSCTVILIDYRLVPKYPYPNGLEDCVTVYTWLLDHAKEFGVDRQRIAICGDSAGGALAASMVQMLKEKDTRMPLFQLLVYPVMDSNCSTGSMERFVDTPIWNSRLNRKMWKLYLPKHQESIDMHHFSPLKSESFEGLPETYIEVSEFDCLRDEAIAYAGKLKHYGVEVELNETKGTIHGFEMNYDSPYTQQIIGKRIDYMKNRFSKT